jgi:hypothetical protein
MRICIAMTKSIAALLLVSKRYVVLPRNRQTTSGQLQKEFISLWSIKTDAFHYGDCHWSSFPLLAFRISPTSRTITHTLQLMWKQQLSLSSEEIMVLLWSPQHRFFFLWHLCHTYQPRLVSNGWSWLYVKDESGVRWGICFSRWVQWHHNCGKSYNLVCVCWGLNWDS